MAKIFVVDDKISVRITIEAVLREIGHQVDSAEDGLDALKQMQMPDCPPYDLIISDIIMPNLNGIEFVTALRSVNVQTPILFMSGGGHDMNAGEILSAAAEISNGILRKPFTNDDLILAVMQLLS